MPETVLSLKRGVSINFKALEEHLETVGMKLERIIPKKTNEALQEQAKNFIRKGKVSQKQNLKWKISEGVETVANLSISQDGSDEPEISGPIDKLKTLTPALFSGSLQINGKHVSGEKLLELEQTMEEIKQTPAQKITNTKQSQPEAKQIQNQLEKEKTDTTNKKRRLKEKIIYVKDPNESEKQRQLGELVKVLQELRKKKREDKQSQVEKRRKLSQERRQTKEILKAYGVRHAFRLYKLVLGKAEIQIKPTTVGTSVPEFIRRANTFNEFKIQRHAKQVHFTNAINRKEFDEMIERLRPKPAVKITGRKE
jgi:hypothetical protein